MKRTITIFCTAVLIISMMVLCVNAATTVTVTDSDGLNIREEPNTNCQVVGSLGYGAQVTILSTQSVDGYIWGEIGNGWIRLDFTDYQAEQEDQEDPEPAPERSDNWKQENGKWYYYVDGVKKIGWINDGGKWYYTDGSGAMQTGWLSVNDLWYYLDSNGVMQTGWLQLGASYYYLNSSGAMQTGWLQLGANWYYLDSSGVMAVGKVKIGEQAHKFDLNGVWKGETANAFSTEGMKILKLEEGFSVKPYWDYTQWTVGYGTKCPDDMVEHYKTYGISQADAEILLRKHMAGMEADIDNFVSKNGLTLTDGQYDALVLLSYNCGSGCRWLLQL